MSMISVKGLRKNFGKHEVLKGIDIEIPVSYTHLTLPTILRV